MASLMGKFQFQKFFQIEIETLSRKSYGVCMSLSTNRISDGKDSTLHTTNGVHKEVTQPKPVAGVKPGIKPGVRKTENLDIPNSLEREEDKEDSQREQTKEVREKEHNKGLQPLKCTSWYDLELAWRKAMKWRRDLGDTLSVMMAVAISTDHPGDQLFLQVIGDAGSGKSRFCDAMLVSPYCYPLEHLNSFHSGWQDGTGRDFSLLARINGKTLITPEADVILSSPKFQEIMGQQRKIYDGASSSSYGNQAEVRRYEGLRTPWIMAGTPALLKSDQSRLGDRYLRIHIDRPSEEERKEILKRVGYAMVRAMNHPVPPVTSTTSDDAPVSPSSRGKGVKGQKVQKGVKISKTGKVIKEGEEERQGGNEGEKEDKKSTSILEESMEKAYRLTGGFIAHLRRNHASLIKVPDPDETVDLIGKCELLAEFTADMRARPDPEWMKKGRGGNGSNEYEPSKETPNRLMGQFVRLALSLSGVLQIKSTHEEIIRRVKRVAMDTSRGISFDIVNRLFHSQDTGVIMSELSSNLEKSEDTVERMLAFLRKIDVVECFVRKERRKSVGIVVSMPKFRLTKRVYEVYSAVSEM